MTAVAEAEDRKRGSRGAEGEDNGVVLSWNGRGHHSSLSSVLSFPLLFVGVVGEILFFLWW